MEEKKNETSYMDATRMKIENVIFIEDSVESNN